MLGIRLDPVIQTPSLMLGVVFQFSLLAGVAVGAANDSVHGLLWAYNHNELDKVTDFVFSSDSRETCTVELSRCNGDTVGLPVIRARNARNGKLVWELVPPTQNAAPANLVCIPRKDRLLTQRGAIIDVWDLAMGKRSHSIGDLPRSTWKIDVAPDGRRLFAGEAGSYSVFDIDTGAAVFRGSFPDHIHGPTKGDFAKFSPNSEVVAVVNNDRSFEVRSTNDGKRKFVHEFEKAQAVLRMLFAETDAHLVICHCPLAPHGHEPGLPHITVFDLEGRVVGRVKGQFGTLLVQTPDAKRLLSIPNRTKSEDEKIETPEDRLVVWRLPDLTEIERIAFHEETVYCSARVPGSWLLACGSKHHIWLWDLQSKREVPGSRRSPIAPGGEAENPQWPDATYTLQVSPDGKLLMTKGELTRIWDIDVLRGTK